MKYIKLIFYILIFGFFAILIYENHEIFTLNIKFFNYQFSLLLFLAILFSLFLLIVICMIFYYRKKISKLEKELNSLRKIQLNNE